MFFSSIYFPSSFIATSSSLVLVAASINPFIHLGLLLFLHRLFFFHSAVTPFLSFVFFSFLFALTEKNTRAPFTYFCILLFSLCHKFPHSGFYRRLLFSLIQFSVNLFFLFRSLFLYFLFWFVWLDFQIYVFCQFFFLFVLLLRPSVFFNVF